MPVMNGFQFVRALRKSRPEDRAVLMTATEISSRMGANVTIYKGRPIFGKTILLGKTSKINRKVCDNDFILPRELSNYL